MIRLIAIAMVGFLSGCSWNTYANGKYGDILRSNVARQNVIAQLGSPVTTTYISDGPYYQKKAGRSLRLRVDRYYTTERIADFHKGSGTGMIAGMTLGLSELIYAPYALFDQYFPRTRQLELIYDEDDSLRNYRLSNKKP
jgi:hypothetical protein